MSPVMYRGHMSMYAFGFFVPIEMYVLGLPGYSWPFSSRLDSTRSKLLSLESACSSQGSPAATASQGKEYLLVFLSHSW